MAAANYGEANNIWNIIPPGYRFRPFDEELITCYLENKVYGKHLPPNKIHEVDLYGEYGPQDLAERNEAVDMDTWYYFTKRERKYENGDRPNRTAGNGFWKATGKDECIKNIRGEVIGFKKSLAFFFGKQIERTANVKSTWLMQEFRLNDASIKEKKKVNSKSKKLLKVAGTTDASHPKPKFMLDGFVLCKVYNHDKGKKSSLEVVQYQATEQTSTASNPQDGPQDGVKGKKRARVASPVARREIPVPLQIQHPQPQVVEQMTTVNHGDTSDPTSSSYQNNMVFQQQMTVVGEELQVVQYQATEQTSTASKQQDGVQGNKRARVASPVARLEYQVPQQIQHPQPQVVEQMTVVNHGDTSDPTSTSDQNNMVFPQQPNVQQPQGVCPHDQRHPSFQLPDVPQMNPNPNNFASNGLIGSAALENSVLQPSPLQRTSSFNLYEELQRIQDQQPHIMEQINGVNHGDISDPTLTSNQNNMVFQQQPYIQQPPQHVWPHQQQPSFQLSDVRQMNPNNFADNGLIGSAAMENSVQPSPLQRTSSMDYFEALLDHITKYGSNSIREMCSDPTC